MIKFVLLPLSLSVVHGLYSSLPLRSRCWTPKDTSATAGPLSIILNAELDDEDQRPLSVMRDNAIEPHDFDRIVDMVRRVRPPTPRAVETTPLNGLIDGVQSAVKAGLDESAHSGSSSLSNDYSQFSNWADDAEIAKVDALLDALVPLRHPHTMSCRRDWPNLGVFRVPLASGSFGNGDGLSTGSGGAVRWEIRLTSVPAGSSAPPEAVEVGAQIMYKALWGDAVVSSSRFVPGPSSRNGASGNQTVKASAGVLRELSQRKLEASGPVYRQLGGPIRTVTAATAGGSSFGAVAGDSCAYLEVVMIPPPGGGVGVMMTGTSDGIALGSQALAQVAAQTAAAAAAAAAEGIVSSPTANGASQIATEEGPLVLRPDLLASVYALFDLRAATELQRKRGFTSALSGEEGSDGSKPRRVLDGVSNPAALDDFVGGLDEQVSTIARRVLATRNLDPTLAQQLGVTNVRGLLLYGPPGCGKTLLARQLALALDAVDCKVVSGPEVLNKFVGTSEERVRELFAGAEHDWQARGAASGLHVVILDELDAICRERGSLAGDSSGVRDSVVNQLLAKLDGVHNAGNLLVVGLTNRRDLIDDAMLRPGRLEVHVEVAWPDAHGRRQILDVHTKAMLRHGLLNRRAWEGDLDVGANSGGSSSSSGSGSSTKSGGTSGSTGIAQRLVEGTAWWSGAELAGLVRTAVSHAVARHLESSGDDVIDSTVATAATASPTAAAATAAANNNNNHQGSGAATSATAEVLPADFELGLSELQVQLAPVLQRRKQQAKASRQEAEAKALRLKRRDELTSSRAVSGSGQWTVRELLQSVELEGEYGSALVHDHDVTWSELLGMSDAQLKECGVLKVGHRLRIIAAVAAAVKDEQQQE